MPDSIANILSIARSEMSVSTSLVRFWLVACVLTVAAVAGFVHSCVYQALTIPTSATFGVLEPRYLLGNIDMLLFVAFQLGVVLLAYDASHRDRRERIQEALESRPFTNLQFLSGRTLGLVFLMWLVVAFNLALLLIVGLTANVLQLGFGDTFQVHSVFNLLLIDAPAVLLIACALTVCLSSAFQWRILSLAIPILFVFSWYWIGTNVPYSFLTFVSPSSNASLFVSELVPQFAAVETLGTRACIVVLAAAFVVAAAVFFNRENHGSKLLGLSVSVALAAAGVVSYGAIAASVVGESVEKEHWRHEHKVGSASALMDVQSLTGDVLIAPGRYIEADFTVVTTVHADEPMRQLVFALNPGLSIVSAALDGHTVDPVFESGLLVVNSTRPIEPGSESVVRVVVRGVPYPRFAYFDSSVDYASDPRFPHRAAALFGVDGSIFHRSFVALMPGVHWYPSSGLRHSDLGSSESTADFFDVDLSVEVTEPGWTVASSDLVEKTSGSESKFRVNPAAPVRELGLFASEFASRSAKIGEITFDVYLHKTHTRNLDVFGDTFEQFERSASAILDRLSREGIEYPYRSLSFVEVPNRLRTVGGGWRMDSIQSLPGLVLIKERGFPITSFDWFVNQFRERRMEDDELAAAKARLLTRHLSDTLGTDNIWNSIHGQFWSSSMAARGPNAGVVDQLMLQVLSAQSPTPYEYFSIYSTTQVADITRMVLPASMIAIMGQVRGNANSAAGIIRSLERQHGTRMAVWDAMETTSLMSLPSSRGYKYDLETVLAKTNLIARSINRENLPEPTLAWLASLQKEFAGSTYTLEDAIRHADEHGVVIRPFLDEWLFDSGMPGYVVSDATIERLRDDDEGNPQYQCSFHIRNTESTSGYFVVDYEMRVPGEQWFRSTSTEGVFIGGRTSKQVNIVSAYPVVGLSIEPFVSLNRGSIDVAVSAPKKEESSSRDQSALLEESDWTPTETGIVVDDLDPGFSTSQPSQDLTRSSTLGPLGWLRVPRLALDEDAGLPSVSDYVHRTDQGAWGRWNDSTAYGKYRRTTARTIYDGRMYEATFESVLPVGGIWSLEYHLPNAVWNNPNTRGTYNLRIVNGSHSSEVEFDSRQASNGWNFIDTFELSSGAVSVTVANVSPSGTWVDADAIRWIAVDAPSREHEQEQGL